MKDLKDQDCKNCGAWYGLHESGTMRCPLHGIEETKQGVAQRWAQTVFKGEDPYITEATIYFGGDPSVGIQSYYYTAQVPKLTEDEEDREVIRQELIKAYTEIDAEFKPMVWFDDERDVI